MGSAIFHYLGPSFAVLLFVRIDVAGVAWLRIASAAVVFAIWRRPWRVFFQAGREAHGLMLALGAVFALMNYSFYRAIDRLPLGTVAAIEFVGPIALALIGSRSGRNLTALALAGTGAYLLTDLRIAGDPAAFGGIGVGVSSSVIPYVFDQLAMTRLPRATYALFVALLPATAVVVGVIVLTQIPTAIEVTAVALVIAGVASHREPAPELLAPMCAGSGTNRVDDSGVGPESNDP